MKFGDCEMKKQKFFERKRSVSIKKIDINKVLVSNKVTLCKNGLKYFITYKGAKIRPLCIFLPKMSAYFMKDDELLEKYNNIWEMVKNNMKKEFHSKPMYNENLAGPEKEKKMSI